MYTSYYQLREEPFQLTPDPRFLHLAEPHRAALDALLTAVLLRKGFAVVTGAVGSGKTTLVHTLLELLAHRRVTSAECATALVVNPTLNRDEFLERLVDEFEVPCNSTSKTGRLLALEQKLLEVDGRGGTSVLFIDEAHLLTVELMEEIRLLSNVDTHKGKVLQVVLSGQVELFRLLDRPETRALKQRIATRCQLRALSFAETRVFIAERFHTAGLSGPVPFSQAALEAVHRYAQGVPRLINLVCDSCLSIGFRTQRRKIEPDIVHDAAFGLDLTEVPVDATVIRPPAIHPRESTDTVPSAVDILIEAMKQGRLAARE